VVLGLFANITNDVLYQLSYSGLMARRIALNAGDV
jgi:hypothetical protein